jgi:outer membrane protein OmpA-like peptidoglycan-associated protein
MARLATKLMNNIGYSLEIRAHTDAIGPDGYNDELSERRGKSAMIFMLRKGVPASRVTFRAFGETRPLADNTTPDGGDNPMGRQINRRVELVVKDAYGAVVETVTLP